MNYPSRIESSRSENDRDEQIAAMDSQYRWTLSRFCSIAWFCPLSPTVDASGNSLSPSGKGRRGETVRPVQCRLSVK